MYARRVESIDVDHYPSRDTQQPRMSPREDPVVYGTWTPDAPLSQEQTEDFARDGYLVLEHLFEPEEVTLLQDEAANLLARPAALQPETVIAEPGGRAVRSIFAVHQQNRLMARLAADSRLAGVARYLLGSEVYLHQSRLNYKPGFKGREFYWHSDFETWHTEDGMPRMRALSMSVLLAENTPHNGPLMLIPGSHRTFLSCVGATPDDHYKQSLRKQEFGVPDQDNLNVLVRRHGIAAPTGAPGTVILFDCNTMHGSNGNITPLPRSNAFFVYNAVSNRLQAPYAAAKPRPAFIAARGTPRPVVPQHGPLREA